MKSNPDAISSDVFTVWGSIEKEINDMEATRATARILFQTIPELAKNLPSLLTKMSVKESFHSVGVNIRFLGLVLMHTTHEESRKALLVEVRSDEGSNLQLVSRVFKNELFSKMRELIERTKKNYHSVAFKEMSLLLSSDGTGDSVTDLDRCVLAEDDRQWHEGALFPAHYLDPFGPRALEGRRKERRSGLRGRK